MSPWWPQEWQEAASLLALLALWPRSPLKRLFIDLHSPALETDGPQTFEGRSTRAMASSSSWCCFPSVNPWIVFLRLVLSRGLAGQEDPAPALDPLCPPPQAGTHSAALSSSSIAPQQITSPLTGWAGPPLRDAGLHAVTGPMDGCCVLELLFESEASICHRCLTSPLAPVSSSLLCLCVGSHHQGRVQAE